MKYSMLDYIHRQPEILQKGLTNKERFTAPFLALFEQYPIKRIYLLGSGTSFHVSSLGAMWFNKYLNVEASAAFPMVFVQNENINKQNVYQPNEILAIGVSQSGTSASTLRAMHKAKASGCITVAFTQDSDSEMASLCDHTLLMPVEKEMVPPETQGYTGALLALHLMTITLADKLGLIADYEQRITELGEMTQTNLPRAIQISEAWISNNRYALSKMMKISITGSNLNYITALEGALKVGETMKRVAHGYETEEFAHLTDLSFDDDDYLFAIIHDGFNPDRCTEIKNLSHQITARVFVISNREAHSKQDCSFDFKIPDDLAPFYYVVPFQLIGAIIAENLGVDTGKMPYDHIKGIAHTEEYFLYDLKNKSLGKGR